MDRMNLHGDSRTAAQQAFRVGKADNYPLREKMRQFRSVCFGRFDLIRMFLEIQIQAAFADGSLHPNEREVLYVIAEELGISRTQFDQFLRMMQGGAQFGGGYQQQQGAGGWQQAQRGPTLEDACNVLGVKPTDDATTIKRAYRKQMSEHHPDKLVAKGLPPEMMEMAKQKAQEIQKAYELIKEQKGFK
jgi:DnaJ like chaperone protein